VDPTRYYFASLLVEERRESHACLVEREEKAMYVCYAQWREERDNCFLFFMAKLYR
jgi:hypothetical protein